MTSEEQFEFLAYVRRVLATGEEWNDDTLHYPAGLAIDAVLTLPGVQKEDRDDTRGADGFDSNGWQWDWWQHFTHGGKRYVLAGSGYHGGHSFTLDDEPGPDDE